MAVLPPMPSASVSTATAVKPGLRRSMRNAYRRSLIISSSMSAPPFLLSELPSTRASRPSNVERSARLTSHSSSRQSWNCASASARASASVRPSASDSSKASSRCSASSSTISASRGPSRPSGASRARTSRTHCDFPSSGIFRVGRDARHAVERVEELLPRVALRGQDPPPLGRQLVITAAALAGLLHPLPLDVAAPLQAVEQRVERGDVELEHAVGALADELGDLVAVARPVLHERLDEHLGGPRLQHEIENTCDVHMWF